LLHRIAMRAAHFNSQHWFPAARRMAGVHARYALPTARKEAVVARA
jgi:hypothetical protein